MKILFLVSNLNSEGGVVRSISNLSNNLIQNNDIDIVSVFKAEKTNMFYSLDRKINKIYLERDLISSKNKVLRQVDIFSKIKNVVLKGEYDIVISTNAHFNIYLAGIKLFNRKIKYIGSEHGAYSHLGEGWRKITKFAYKNLDKLVLLTKKEKEVYEAFSYNISVIPNISSFNVTNYNKLENKKLLSVGRIDENKNYKETIEAFSLISNKYKEWTLDIVGSGDKEDEECLKKYIKDIGLNDKVSLISFSKEIEKYYKNSDIFLMTSKEEGLPMVLIEAMSYKVPCISYDIKTGPSDIIIDGQNGYLINFDDDRVNNLAMKIEELIVDTDKREKMGTYAMNSVERFDKRTVVNKWEECFKELMKNA